jgi:hypothetical protein
LCSYILLAYSFISDRDPKDVWSRVSDAETIDWSMG